MELAEIIRDAIAGYSTVINQIARRNPDRPIQLELSWMPQTAKLDIAIKPVIRIPSYRPILPAPPPS